MRQRVSLLVLSVTALVLGGAGSALAGSVKVDLSGKYQDVRDAVFYSFPGERNELSLVQPGDRVTLRDAGAPLVNRGAVELAQVGCDTVDAYAVTCLTKEVYANLGDGDDSFSGAAAAQVLHVEGRSGADRLMGGPRDDELEGGPGANLVDGRGGLDRVSGQGQLFGGSGRDSVSHVGGGPARLVGGEGNDFLFAGNRGDSLSCGPGRDEVAGVLGVLVARDCERFSPHGWIATVFTRGRVIEGRFVLDATVKDLRCGVVTLALFGSRRQEYSRVRFRRSGKLSFPLGSRGREDARRHRVVELRRVDDGCRRDAAWRVRL